MRFLKKHPFAVQAHFNSSLVLTFAAQKEQLQSLIPEPLELDTFDNHWAFVAIAMVDTKGLRPKGFPKILGNDFFLIGYRIFVRYTNQSGKRLRGLYILQSQTNKKKMEYLGNIFTHYQYSTIDINRSYQGRHLTISSELSDFNVTIADTSVEVQLPEESPFATWKEARRYAGPLPHTFSVSQQDKTVLTILGVRQNWSPKAVQVKDYHFAFLDQLKLNDVVLASAFEVTDVPYHWHKGKLERWA